MIQENLTTGNYFTPFRLKKCDNESPDMPAFKKHKLHVFVSTRNGRPVFSRYGNEIKCSSFLATFSAIAGKISKFYSDNPETQTMYKVNHGGLTIYLLRRKFINYLCISKGKHSELKILSMLDFVNTQLISCFTDKLNTILGEKQGYDPTSNFNPTTVNLISSAIKNGLHSPCVFLNAIPILCLPGSCRNQLFSMMKELKSESLQLFVLMTMTQIVGIFKTKQIDVHPQDMHILFNLFHTQKSLRNTQNWFPICLPGIQDSGQLFCYSNFITEHLVVVILTDQMDDFEVFSQGCKSFRSKLTESQVIKRINKVLSKPQLIQIKVQRISMLQHFLVRHNETNQIIMSRGNFFGRNTPELQDILNHYANINKVQLMMAINKKSKILFETVQQGSVCLFVASGYTILFYGREVVNLQDSKFILDGVLKWLKEEENNLFIHKYI